MSAEFLSTDDILRRMAEALPKHEEGDDSSDVASSYEVFALLVHAYLIGLDFTLLGFSEERPLPECMLLAPRLPAEWNKGFGSFSFAYKHNQSSMNFVFKVDRMGAKVEVRGLAIGQDRIHRFERTVRNVIQSQHLPIRIRMTEEGEEDRSDLPEQLRKVFVSDAVITSFVSDLETKVVQKIMPGLQKDPNAKVQTPNTREAALAERRVREAQEFTSNEDNSSGLFSRVLPHMAQPRPRAPMADFPPPGFEDEHQVNQPPGAAGGPAMPGRSPFNIGHDDLNPQGLGPHDPLRPHITPGGLPQPGGFAGMHPTFDDPLFTGQGGWGGGHPNPGAGGQGFYDPQAPPGARWDPVGPGGTPRFPGQGRGQGNPGGNGGYNPYGGGFGGFGGGGNII